MTIDTDAVSCQPVSEQIAGGIQVGTVWSGVGTGIGSATTAAGVHLFAYYDADRFLTIASLDPAGTRICRKRLGSRFGGWDAHNALALAVAPDDSVHIAGNMHASPMVYARGSAGDIATIKLGPMIGQDEAAATYPHFLHDSDGALIFMYRDGGSGAGRWLLNRWQGGAWRRIGALFQDHDRQGHVSAYPTNFVRGTDGRFHVAVVWRRTNDVASNFALSYASTTDFRRWKVGSGADVEGPLSPETMSSVDHPGENAGLVNNASLAVTGAGVPIILYTKYAANGRNAIFAARMQGGPWVVKPIATGPVRADMAGRGSIPNLPAATFPGPARGNQLAVNVSLPGLRLHDRMLDADQLALLDKGAPAAHQPDAVVEALMAEAKGMADVQVQGTTTHLNGLDTQSTGHLRWFAQTAHADRPRDCTAKARRACEPPPSPLLWFPAK